MATKQSVDKCMQHFKYRWVKIEDIIPGRELLMIDLSPDFCTHIDPKLIGTLIRIDDVENDVVYYHCINPPWEGQCFAKLVILLTQEYNGGFSSERIAYWIQQPVPELVCSVKPEEKPDSLGDKLRKAMSSTETKTNKEKPVPEEFTWEDKMKHNSKE